jgi:hypothetical protein
MGNNDFKAVISTKGEVSRNLSNAVKICGGNLSLIGLRQNGRILPLTNFLIGHPLGRDKDQVIQELYEESDANINSEKAYRKPTADGFTIRSAYDYFFVFQADPAKPVYSQKDPKTFLTKRQLVEGLDGTRLIIPTQQGFYMPIKDVDKESLLVCGKVSLRIKQSEKKQQRLGKLNIHLLDNGYGLLGRTSILEQKPRARSFTL